MKVIPYKEIDRHAPDIAAVLKAAPVYRKFGYIHARYARPGEKVATVLADGKTETMNIATRGDWVIINATGESEIMNSEKFHLRYEKIEEGGVYASKGFIKAIKNPFGVSVEIQSAWGFPQKGAVDCYFADTCTADGGLSGDPYLIDGTVFEKTYSEYEKNEIIN